MLIKPLISKQSLVTISSLPISNKNDHSSSNERAESQNYLDTYGRLLMLTILYNERSIKFNKHNHDKIYERNRYHSHNWSLCKCDYAKYIRGEDMGLNSGQIERMREVI